MELNFIQDTSSIYSPALKKQQDFLLITIKKRFQAVI